MVTQARIVGSLRRSVPPQRWVGGDVDGLGFMVQGFYVQVLSRRLDVQRAHVWQVDDAQPCRVCHTKNIPGMFPACTAGASGECDRACIAESEHGAKAAHG